MRNSFLEILDGVRQTFLKHLPDIFIVTVAAIIALGLWKLFSNDNEGRSLYQKKVSQVSGEAKIENEKLIESSLVSPGERGAAGQDKLGQLDEQLEVIRDKFKEDAQLRGIR